MATRGIGYANGYVTSIRSRDRAANASKNEYLYQKLGLFRLERFSTNLPWAKA